MRHFVITGVLVLLATPTPACDLKVAAAWIRTAPPTATVLAGYATFANGGAQPLRIRGLRSADFVRVEAHETRDEKGISKMRAIDAFEIPAGGSMELQPGGRHLMLMQPKRVLKDGDVVSIAIEDTNGCVTTAAFKVAGAPKQAGKMDHGAH